MNPANASYYITGGTLPREAASYVPRKADADLLDGLLAGQFCYVLTSRQMGKSSLMVRAAGRLREQGVSVAVLDLTAIGQNLSPEQWYGGMLDRIGKEFGLEDALDDFWMEQERVGPLQRFMRALREIVLERVSGPVVVLVDEIDAVRSLPFSTDEFFAGIRETYNRRSEDPALERLTFCLLGVATPADLIRDTRTTPFNIGKRIELTDFTEEEAAPLTRGLGRGIGTILLQRILYWTGGHPYLTQRLCQAVASAKNVNTFAMVDSICSDLFFSSSARERDDNLLFVRERLLRSEGDLARLMQLYARVHTEKNTPGDVRDDAADPCISLLRLSGIVRNENGFLCVRNRIYHRIFDRKWARANTPSDAKGKFARLLWDQKIRGALPLSSHCVSDQGAIRLLCPDATLIRTYNVLEFARDRENRALYSVYVETVRAFAASANADLMLGISDRNIYQFHEGRKSRLFPDARLRYSDVALARDGLLFAYVGYAMSDSAGIAHHIGLSGISGQTGWSRQIGQGVHRIALAGNGRMLAIGQEDGVVQALSDSQQILWRCETKETITALALDAKGSHCLVGTQNGGLRMLDGQGGVIWKARVELPALAVGMDDSGAQVVVAAGDYTRGLLSGFDAQGRLCWEYDLDVPPGSLALSPGGRYLAVLLAGGLLLLFEMDFPLADGGTTNVGKELQEIETLAGNGDLLTAYQRLLRLLTTRPEDTAAGKRLTEIANTLIAARITLAREHAGAGRTEAAQTVLDAAQGHFPYDERLFGERRALWRAQIEALQAAAERALEAGDSAQAAARWKELLRLDPHHPTARERLSQLRQG